MLSDEELDAISEHMIGIGVDESEWTEDMAKLIAQAREANRLRATNARLAEAVKAADFFIKRHTDGRGCTTKLDPLNCGSTETMIESVAAALQPAPDALLKLLPFVNHQAGCATTYPKTATHSDYWNACSCGLEAALQPAPDARGGEQK